MPEPNLPTSFDESPARPVPWRRLLAAFRDLGVPPDEDPGEQLACEPSLNRYTAFWVFGETLDATYAALEGMRLADEERAEPLLTRLEPRLYEFLHRHYDSEGSRFVTDCSDRTGGLFAAHTGLGVLRSLARVDGNENLGEERAQAGLARIDVESESIHDLLAACRAGDGVVENPAHPLIPTVTALYTASSILWNLEGNGSDRLPRFIEPRRLERFLLGCLRRQRVDERRIAGFVIHPDHQELCVNTTYFGLQLMKRLEIPLDLERQREIESFLTLSYCEGGFRSTRREPRSLNATFWGLRGLALVMPPDRWLRFRESKRGRIAQFLLECRRQRGGGAPFARDPKRFVENCLATRYWLQIPKLLEFPLSSEQSGEVFRFYEDRLNEETGGFESYPPTAVDRRDLTPAALEAALERKDATLLRHHDAKLDDPSRPPAYAPDTKMIELYERLEELERSLGDAGPRDRQDVERRIEETWRQLRLRQEEEADRFEAHFEAEVLAPLRAGRADLTEIRERLSR